MDDSVQSSLTLWSSTKTATEIASGGFDQQLNTIDDVGFNSVTTGNISSSRPSGENTIVSVGQLFNPETSMFVNSNDRSLLQMNSNTFNLIKFVPGTSATAKLFCIEHKEALDNLIFAYDPFGVRREPLKIESQFVTVSKLNVNGAYTLPDVDGSTSGEMLTTDGSGNVTWQTPAATTLEDAYNASTVPQITTTAANPRFTIKDSGEFQVGPVLDLLDANNDRLFAVDAVAGVNIKDQYSLPNVDGSADQVIQTDGVGACHGLIYRRVASQRLHY
jgi:hypothetical protein